MTLDRTQLQIYKDLHRLHRPRPFPCSEGFVTLRMRCCIGVGLWHAIGSNLGYLLYL